MPDFAVSTAFNASGNVLKKIGAMDKGINRFGDSSTRAFRKASRAGTKFGNIVKGILVADVLKGALRGLTAGLRTTTEEFINYDQAITSASAKFKDLNTNTIEGQKTLQSLMDTARQVGATTEFSATQAAQGLDFLAMAGFSAEQAIATLPGVVDLATVAQTDLARATDIASDSLGAFGLMTDDTVQLQKNFTRVNDVFAKTMTTANTNMEALFESVTKGGPAFTAAGQSIETFSALAGVMANSGVKGSESGTALRNVMLRLASPAAGAAKIMEDLGVKIKDSQGNFIDVIDILGDFEKGLEGMGTAQRTAALSTVFGARSVTGVNILLKEGTKSLRDYRDGLIDSAGASKTMADVIRGSIGNQLASLKSAALEVGFQFIDTFKDKIGPAIASFTEQVRSIDVAAIVDNFKSFIDVALRFRGVLFGMAAGWVAFKVAMGGAAIFRAIKGFILFSKALRAAAAAQGILNAVMMANPLGLVIAAIAVLVAGVVLLIDNFDAIASFFGFGDNKINEGEGSASERIAPNESTLAAQEIRFQGQLNIAGAPEGSTAESEISGAPGIRMDLAGVNP